jgi:hypothetical protein
MKAVFPNVLDMIKSYGTDPTILHSQICALSSHFFFTLPSDRREVRRVNTTVMTMVMILSLEDLANGIFQCTQR